MNKIIVVGHPQSGYKQVLQLLTECGMAPALPSRRDSLTPEQISATLIKAHGAAPVDQVQTTEQLQQIKVAPVWQGMVLDLMLSNLDLPLWGWADTQAVYLLEYWKKQDPQAAFVLVYDEPQTIYTRLSLQQAAAPPAELQRRLDAWVAYNAALLHFYLRNPQRSVLVHARQVLRSTSSANSYLQQLSERLAAPLQLPSSQLPDTQAQEPEQIIAAPSSDLAADLPHNAQVVLLSSLLVNAHPQAQALYEELQAAASLPLTTEHTPPTNHEGDALVVASPNAGMQAHYQAWQACVAQYQMLADSAKAQQALQIQTRQLAETQQKENDLLLTQLQKVQGDYERLHLQGKEQEQQLQTRARQQSEIQARLKAQEQAAQTQTEQLTDAQEENDLLLTQLHKVQEDYERLYLQGKGQEQQLQTQVKQQAETQAKLKAQEQAAQAQEQIVRAQLASAQTELQKTQAELERYAAENSQLKAEQKPEPQAYYGAAERVKQQLSYRLGATMITRSRSLGGWLGMPFALRAQVKQFRRDQSANKGQNLPPIKQYNDADEAERIKQHLSYRLGARMLVNTKSLGGWVAMPWALYAEVKDFRTNHVGSPLVHTQNKSTANSESTVPAESV